MDAITATELAQLQAQGQALTLLDVRRDSARLRDGTQIARSAWHNPAQWLDWKDQVPKDVPVVLYCAHGQEISQGLTTVLHVMGLNARYLDGGIAAWQAAKLATEPAA
ncbi:sulfurtransferase [Rhodoferax sp. TH121]|uniref:rhodanese-like domain-containing protein n=1 Tax=Rhodoferax sp. TH121 TaxID=2022803 RepID=UPI000B960475|nr:rhodanese-like domain-containing protein [Rhodoferax sp. TH121]OYQ39683.1 sulfurtransferase [Rhodoferax sp. TH121]